MNNTPPRLFHRFFRWFCHPRLYDSIEGDLIELYEEHIGEYGKRSADIMFIKDVILLFRPGIIRPLNGNQQLITYDMFRNYFKISIRQLIKNKAFAAINATVLTLGFSCFILLSLYLYDELSFDMFHRDAKNIYRVIQYEQQENGITRDVASIAPAIGKEVMVQFEEVEDMCRLSAFGRITVGNDPVTRTHERVLSADHNFFTFFDFPLIEGNPKTALSDPYTIVISETTKQKYFGEGDALGKQIWSGYSSNGNPVYLTVSGVMKDFPKNSHLQFSIVFSDVTWHNVYRDYTQYVNTNWVDTEYTTYLKLKPNSSSTLLTKKIEELVKSNYPTDREFNSQFELQSLKSIHTQSDHLQSAADEFNAKSIKPFYLYTFAALAVLLLLTGCLNYMNLSTAVAIKRTREIGTRKVLGAHKLQMVMQFITDTLVISSLALLLSFAIVYAVLPAFNMFTGKEMQLTTLPLEWIVGVLGTILVIGITAAMYPAFIASRVSIVDALKREIKIGNSSFSVRKALLVVQFGISMIMITSTLVIYQQLDYMRNKDLGFNHNNLLVIDINSRNLRRDFEIVKAEFASQPEITSVTASTRVPGEWKSYPITTTKSEGNTIGTDMVFVGIDRDFLATYQIKLLAGRTIQNPKADSLKVVLTELAVEQLGLTNPIGQIIEIPKVRYGERVEELNNPFRVEIIGVVENFHFESLRSQMLPVIFGAPNTAIQVIDYYTLRVNTNNWNRTLESLKAINSKLDPDNPLEFTFLDVRFDEMYRADAKRGQIFLVLSIIVVVIACLGLFALVSYAVEARTKEIGVRKVLGASVHSIVNLIAKEFLPLVVIAGGVGLPVAWYFMRNWLHEFAYHIPFGIQIAIESLLITFIIALVTIGVRVTRAARVNPVESLRSE